MSFQRFPRIWIGSVRQWHWISSALCLVGMFLFAFTGITLNHAGQIEAKPQTETIEHVLPENLLQSIRELAEQNENSTTTRLPLTLRQWLTNLDIHVGGRQAEWSTDEIYVAMPRPGGDAWLAIDLDSGELLFEDTDRGIVSYLNDLHKARNTGTAWAWFIDIFSLACLVFCTTGLWLLYRHSASRRTTWPIVGLGLMIPLLLAILFVHQ